MARKALKLLVVLLMAGVLETAGLALMPQPAKAGTLHMTNEEYAEYLARHSKKRKKRKRVPPRRRYRRHRKHRHAPARRPLPPKHHR